MQLVHLPLLEIQRELYALPRGRARFDAYIRRMTGPDGDLRLPLTSMNPMAHDHVARSVEDWLAAGAEAAASAAIEEARSRGAVPNAEAFSARAGGAEAAAPVTRAASTPRDELQIGLLIADDVRGGWTNRYTTDFANRFESQPLLRRGFGVALLWASEAPSAEVARRETLQACGRALWQTARGFGRTVRELLAQEEFARRFAGEAPKALPDARLLDASDPATVIAVLYGDEGASALGHPPLGIEAALQ